MFYFHIYHFFFHNVPPMSLSKFACRPQEIFIFRATHGLLLKKSLTKKASRKRKIVVPRQMFNLSKKFPMV